MLVKILDLVYFNIIFVDLKLAFKIAENYHAEALCVETTSFNFAECKTWRRGKASFTFFCGKFFNKNPSKATKRLKTLRIQR